MKFSNGIRKILTAIIASILRKHTKRTNSPLSAMLPERTHSIIMVESTLTPMSRFSDRLIICLVTVPSGDLRQESISRPVPIGAEKGNELIKAYLDRYSGRRFIQNDGSIDLTTNVSMATNLLQQRGLILNDTQQVIGEDNVVYPQRYFSPYHCRTGVLSIHSDTIAVHYYSNTWNSTRWFRFKRMFKNSVAKLAGKGLSNALWLGREQ